MMLSLEPMICQMSRIENLHAWNAYCIVSGKGKWLVNGEGFQLGVLVYITEETASGRPGHDQTRSMSFELRIVHMPASTTLVYAHALQT